MTTKFEVGKEYVTSPGATAPRKACVGAGDVLAILRDSEGEEMAVSHGLLQTGMYRSAPRTVERWIAIDRLAHTVTTTKKEDAADWAKERSGVVSGPFKIEVPW